MTVATQAHEYEAIQDPAQLRIALRELHRVRAWIAQFTDVAAEMPGSELRQVSGATAITTAVVSLLIERAEARLRALTARPTPAEVVVLDPERRQLVNRADRVTAGFAVLPMVTEPTVATSGLSSAVLRLEPGRATVPHVYPDFDVITIVVFGAVDLIWWDDGDIAHRVTHKRHQHAYIRRGTRHCVVNSGAARLLAVQVRATADVTAGMELLPDLPVDLTTGLTTGLTSVLAAAEPSARPTSIAE